MGRSMTFMSYFWKCGMRECCDVQTEKDYDESQRGHKTCTGVKGINTNNSPAFAFWEIPVCNFRLPDHETSVYLFSKLGNFSFALISLIYSLMLQNKEIIEKNISTLWKLLYTTCEPVINQSIPGYWRCFKHKKHVLLRSIHNKSRKRCISCRRPL